MPGNCIRDLWWTKWYWSRCISQFLRVFLCKSSFRKSRDSSVGIATGYGLDDQRFGVRVPMGARIFTSPCRPDRLGGPPSLLSNGYRSLYPRGKAAGVWNWPLTSKECWGQENVGLYIHSPIHIHGVVLNYLSTGTTLPFYLLILIPLLLLTHLPPPPEMCDRPEQAAHYHILGL
jgi:hypothetical protein